MSRNPTIEDLKKMGYAANSEGVYVPVKSLVAKGKIKKLPNLIDRALVQQSPNNKVIADSGAKVFIKPLSVNDAWKGERYKTDEYKQYDLALSFLLPKHVQIPAGKLKVHYEWGLSSDGGDWDAPIKQAQDIIARRYGFNDNRIMFGSAEKIIVPKGQEYVKFHIEIYDKV